MMGKEDYGSTLLVIENMRPADNNRIGV